jgi:hypothetical protein
MFSLPPMEIVNTLPGSQADKVLSMAKETPPGQRGAFLMLARMLCGEIAGIANLMSEIGEMYVMKFIDLSILAVIVTKERMVVGFMTNDPNAGDPDGVFVGNYETFSEAFPNADPVATLSFVTREKYYDGEPSTREMTESLIDSYKLRGVLPQAWLANLGLGPVASNTKVEDGGPTKSQLDELLARIEKEWGHQ